MKIYPHHWPVDTYAGVRIAHSTWRRKYLPMIGYVVGGAIENLWDFFDRVREL